MIDMYCKYCGEQIDQDSIFCSSCGHNLDSLKNNDQNKTKKEIDVVLKLKGPSFKIKRPKKEFKKSDKYDRSYNKKTEATGIGVLLLLGSVVLYVFSLQGALGKTNAALFAIIIFIIRIIVVISVSEIAAKQNRSSGSWGFFAFLFPALALIIIGQLRKLKGIKSINTHKATVNSSSKEYVDQRSDSLEVKPGFIKVRDLQSEKVDIYSKTQWNLIRSNHPNRFYKILVDKTKETI